MHSPLASPSQTILCVRLVLLATLILLLSGWTCSAFFFWGTCGNQAASAQIVALSPDVISREAGSVPLIVEGSEFTPEAKILWNGNALETTFHDAHHLQATITQETFESYGGSEGSSVLISVRPQGSVTTPGCPKQQDSAAQSLIIQ